MTYLQMSRPELADGGARSPRVSIRALDKQ